MIPTQDKVNWEDPKQHFAWALRNIPTLAGTGTLTHPGIILGWSEHLWNCGFAHRDYLESLADEDGNIHVSKLPVQTLRWHQAFRGPNSLFNNASRWTTEEEDPIEPMRVPDVKQYTQQEAAYMYQQLIEMGFPAPYTSAGPPLGGEEE